VESRESGGGGGGGEGDLKLCGSGEWPFPLSLPLNTKTLVSSTSLSAGLFISRSSLSFPLPAHTPLFSILLPLSGGVPPIIRLIKDFLIRPR